MTTQRDVEIEEIRAILRDWRDSAQNLYAVVLDERGVQTCAGNVASLDEERATITDSCIDLRIPYASASDSAVITLTERSRSVTLTWRNGTSAFITTKNTPADAARRAADDVD